MSPSRGKLDHHIPKKTNILHHDELNTDVWCSWCCYTVYFECYIYVT